MYILRIEMQNNNTLVHPPTSSQTKSQRETSIAPNPKAGFLIAATTGLGKSISTCTKYL